MEAFEIIVIVYLVLFIGLLFTGFPIAWILGGLSLLFAGAGILLSNVFDVDTFLMDGWPRFAIIADRVWAQVQNWVLVALPMFIFMGQMLDRSGVAETLMTNFVRVFGRLRGGLALTVVIIGVLLAASTGIVGASVVLLAVMSIPIMLENGYSKELATGVVAASGTLGILIPPSIMLVLMADQLAISVGDLFMGALIPGLMLGFFYMLYVLVLAQFRPDLAPPPKDLPPVDLKSVLMTLLAVIPPAALIVAVLGSIFFGIATPTEAAGLGAFGAMLLAAFAGAARGLHRDDAHHLVHLRPVHRRHRLLAGHALVRRRRVHRRRAARAALRRDRRRHLHPADRLHPRLLPRLAGDHPDHAAPGGPGGGGARLRRALVHGDLRHLPADVVPRGIIPFVILQLACVVAAFVWQDLVLWLPEAVYGAD